MAKRTKIDRALVQVSAETKPKGVEALLADESKINTYIDYIKMGASLGTVEAKLQLSPGSLTRWLAKGKVRKNSPYRQLYLIHIDAVSEARLLAEGTMKEKNPEKWLEKNSSARIVEDTLPSSTASTSVGQAFGFGQVIGALQVLRKQGIDINSIIDSGKIELLQGPSNANDQEG